MINNAHSIGHRMSFTPADILCCPPPLFHCFGLVLGLLVCITHGSTIVLPSPSFSAPAVLAAVAAENCTALHGVPAMFEELLSLPRPATWSCPNLRTGIVAGAPVPVELMERMVGELNMREFTSSYGLTEASPTCFNAHAGDSIHRKLTTVGRVLPHLRSKIIDRHGAIVPVGTRGELCMAGYSLQKGYWNNPDKTREVMIRDEQGVVWLHTGDEAVFDAEGYCTITGRFKDIIIRGTSSVQPHSIRPLTDHHEGGENIYPLEVESRLVAHPSGLIVRAAVVGIPHPKYGEVVGAFLLPTSPSSPSSSSQEEARPTDDALRAWVREVLGRHKAPAHIFWFGDAETGMSEVPQTGSGKVKKHVLRDVAGRIVGGR
jgi:acyl-CoA synthetase (AMP-forming)/AMP-acid ligase II